jgi:hypothetical protein
MCSACAILGGGSSFPFEALAWTLESDNILYEFVEVRVWDCLGKVWPADPCVRAHGKSFGRPYPKSGRWTDSEAVS